MRLDPKDHTFLRAKGARRILAALPEGSTRFVGGCVRNALLGEPGGDIDMATQLRPDEVAKRMREAGIAVHETGLSHGTLTLVASGEVVEITTLRKDVSTDGRRATVSFTTDWALDAKRRDFTINALYADADGLIHDPTAQGLADIKARRVRFVGNPETRIREDYLRILRFFRFNAWYARDGALERAGLAACRNLQAGLEGLSAERVWAETKKLLAAPKPHRVVNLMLAGGILETLLPEASNVEGLGLLQKLEEEKALAPDSGTRLMALCARDEFLMARLCKRLKMSNREKTRFLRWAMDRAALAPAMSEKELAMTCYKSGRQTIMDRVLLRAAGASDPVLKAGWWQNYQFAKAWEKPEFPLKGKDLIAAGFASGPKLGKTLQALEALWLRSNFTADKAKLLMAARLVAGQNKSRP